MATIVKTPCGKLKHCDAPFSLEKRDHEAAISGPYGRFRRGVPIDLMAVRAKHQKLKTRFDELGREIEGCLKELDDVS